MRIARQMRQIAPERERQIDPAGRAAIKEKMQATIKQFGTDSGVIRSEEEPPGAWRKRFNGAATPKQLADLEQEKRELRARKVREGLVDPKWFQ